MKIKVNHYWGAVPRGAFKTGFGAEEEEEEEAETHFYNCNFNLHIRWQIQFRLKASRHGNQQMNGGQKVFVVDDWQASSVENKTQKKTTCMSVPEHNL